MARNPLHEIAGILGDSLQTVVRVYAHVCPDMLRRGVETLDPAGADWRERAKGVP